MAPFQTSFPSIDTPAARIFGVVCYVIIAIWFIVLSLKIIINHQNTYRLITKRPTPLALSNITNEFVKSHIEEYQSLYSSAPIANEYFSIPPGPPPYHTVYTHTAVTIQSNNPPDLFIGLSPPPYCVVALSKGELEGEP